MSAVRQVAKYGDLIGDADLSVEQADAISKALGKGFDLAAALPEWLASDKRAAGFGGCETVVAGYVEHETEKAYLLSNPEAEDWFPKSQITTYEATPDAELYLPGDEQA